MKCFLNNLLHMAILELLAICVSFLLFVKIDISLHQELKNVFS